MQTSRGSPTRRSGRRDPRNRSDGQISSMATPGAGTGERSQRYGSRALARNATLNLAAQLAPAPAALVALPILARAYPPETLGLLTMAWAVLGYFSLLDLGLGRALTQAVAARLSVDQCAGNPVLVRRTSFFLLGVGGIGSLMLWAGADAIASTALRISPALVPETRMAIRVLAVGLPFVTLASAFRGVLEAHLRFDLVNAVRFPASALMYLGPVAVLPFSVSIVSAVSILVTLRMAACIAYGVFTLRVEPALFSPGDQGRGLTTLLGTGAWLTLSNLAATALGVLDRVVIGALVPVSSVAYYGAPQELASKFSIVPSAISGVMFPAFSAHAASDASRRGRLFARATRYTFLLLFPVTLALAAVAPETLALWLGREYAVHGTPLLQWFCFGILVNGLAFTPLALLQAGEGAATAAILQVAELPVFVAALWLATGRFGLSGAAAVWGVRMVGDTCCLFAFARREAGLAALPPWRSPVFGVLAGAAFAAIGWTSSLAGRLALLAVALAGAAVIALRTSDEAEREGVRVACRRFRRGMVE
jgi:O-antigen/teichoic acid export membrane protein